MISYNRGPELVVKVTKDGTEIMEELSVQFPAAKVISEAAKIHREHVGDGVSTFLILLAGLMREAERLKAAGAHPNVILHGYAEAARKAVEIIDAVAVAGDDTSLEALLQLVDCGRGLLTKKLRGLVLEAVERASKDGKIDTKRIRIVRKAGGEADDSQLIDGVLLKRKRAHDNMPDSLDGVRVALVSKRLDIKPLDIKMPGEGHFPLKLDITNEHQMSKFREGEHELKMQMVEKLKSLRANVVISRSPIAEGILDALSRESIFAIMSADQEDLDAISVVTGAKIVAEVRHLVESDLGRADKIETGKIELEDTVTIRTKRGITLLLRASSPEDLQELERIVHNSIVVLRHARNGGKFVPGGGAILMQIVTELRKFALSFMSREQLAVNSFADALEEIPQSLARNFGFNPSDTLVKLRQSHLDGKASVGVSNHGCTNMLEDNVRELAVVDKAVINRALEVASLMLRIDDFIFVKELAMVHKK